MNVDFVNLEENLKTTLVSVSDRGRGRVFSFNIWINKQTNLPYV